MGQSSSLRSRCVAALDQPADTDASRPGAHGSLQSAREVVLNEATHAAYQRAVGRIVGIWHAGDPLAPGSLRSGPDKIRQCVESPKTSAAVKCLAPTANLGGLA